MGQQWPSMKARRMRALLTKLCGEPVRREGSHARYKALEGPDFTFSKHDKDELSGGLVRSILVEDVGLSESEARRVARRGKL